MQSKECVEVGPKVYKIIKEMYKYRVPYKGIKNLHCREGLGKLFGVRLK